MKTVFIFWLIVALSFLIFEMGHPGLFFFLSFSLGALITGLVSLWVPSYIIQSLVFLAGSTVSFFVLRYWVRARMFHSKKDEHTNIYALHGKHGFVVVQITSNKAGQVKVGGETWSARSVDASSIDIGTEVKVVAVSGVHLRVERVEEEIEQKN